MIPEIRIEDYNYSLPDERIAKYPLPQRDGSKLLHYKEGLVTEKRFSDISSLLPEGSIMVFNDTKVVPARLHFQRSTGAHIEIFCLEPVQPEEYVTMFAVTDKCRWKCIVGNVKRWKNDTLNLYNPDSNEMGIGGFFYSSSTLYFIKYLIITNTNTLLQNYFVTNTGGTISVSTNSYTNVRIVYYNDTQLH